MLGIIGHRHYWHVLLLGLVAVFAFSACDSKPGPRGLQGEQGDPGPPGEDAVADTGIALESCVGCHGAGGEVPVADITDDFDAHYVDTDADGPMTPSLYRQLKVTITSVDLRNSNVEISFDVTDENDDPVADIFAADGRFTIAKLLPGAKSWDPTHWQSLIETTENPGGVGDGPGTPAQQANAETFTTSGGSFVPGAPGSYTYTSAFDPTTGSYPAQAGETMRVAIQISAGDIPAGNGWCDFDATFSGASDCTSSVGQERDIVQTNVCNDCHGVTSDTHLALHGGGRTDVEYCVTCHNPGTTDANSGNSVNLTVLVHKIHRGAQLANGYKIWGYRNSLHDYSEINFTKELDNCQVCHQGSGAQVDNWKNVPSQVACGSCHDDVDFAAGVNHPVGVGNTGNEFCAGCHMPDGTPAAVSVVHKGAARITEAERYASSGGYVIEDVTLGSGSLLIDYSVQRDGGPMSLTAPEWTAPFGASRLAVTVGWDSENYTNEGSGSTPAGPISINALDVGGVVTSNPDGTYTVEATLPSSASGTATVAIEGHPAADLDGDGSWTDRIAVVNAYEHVALSSGGRVTPHIRDDVVDVGKCNACHDSAGQGISLHGNNRTGEVQVCVVCHNADATDISQRITPPFADGKDEEAIDFKRLIHQIHSGAELENGIVIYGFNESENDFSGVEFIGNRQNCETCHLPGTYATEAAWETLGSTISTGADEADPADDLNISPIAAVCSSCHDDDLSKDHMIRNGASFQALDGNIHY